jgi:tetratricopeptide (TPR) repeat protein
MTTASIARAALPPPRIPRRRPPARVAALSRAAAATTTTTTTTTRRRALALSLAAAVLAPSSAPLPATAASAAAAAAASSSSEDLARAFADAMALAGDDDAADAAWTRAIAIDPTNAAAWGNRGTSRLQAGRWADARDDLEKAVGLSADANAPDALTLNNLGNAEGACGHWDVAASLFLEASASRDLRDIALANFALAKFQIGDVDAALRATRSLLRRDPEFWDARAATAAFLWARGDEEDAEAEWTKARPGPAPGPTSPVAYHTSLFPPLA